MCRFKKRANLVIAKSDLAIYENYKGDYSLN